MVLHIFRILREIFAKHGFEFSPTKIALLVSQNEIFRSIRQQRSDGDPTIYDIVKDWDVDSTGCRRRRLVTQKARQSKVVERSKQLLLLKIPVRQMRIRLVHGSLHPAMFYGIEAHVSPPSRMRILRLMLGRHCGLQSKGNLDCLFQLVQDRYAHPFLTVLLRQVRAMHVLVKSWPASVISWLEDTWSTSWRELSSKTHPWKSAKGPLQALQTMLLKDGWQACELNCWTYSHDDKTWTVHIEANLHICLKVVQEVYATV